MDDLRSQLVKAGLVSQKQVRKADSDRRKERKAVKRPKRAEPVQDPEVLRRKQELEEARRLDRERQQQAHQQRESKRREKADAERRASEAAEQARRIIQGSGRALSEEAEHEYRYVVAGRTVRTVRVTEEQRQALSSGELGLVRPHAHLQQYFVLERAEALRLREICPEKLLVLHDPEEEEDEFGGLIW